MVRDNVYFRMNECGYGVVSLYHELISDLKKTFIVENDLSDRIINLPLHQDVAVDTIDKMVHKLIEII